MDHAKHQSGASSSSSSSSSFTENLFGPKDASTTSSGLFSSVFGPSSTGLGRRSSHYNNIGSLKKHEHGSGKSLTQDYKTQRITGRKEGNFAYQNETAEPSYLSSSIYYGGQEVYSPNTHTNHHQQHTFKKDGGDDHDPNGSSASRGNWWQGSLYY